MNIRLPLVPGWVRVTGVIFVLAVISYYSIVTTPSDTVSQVTFWDKHLHFLAYFGLTSILVYATVQYRDRPLLRVLIVLGIAITIGGIIELIQGSLTARQFGWGDFAANVLGAVLASLFIVIERRFEYVRIQEVMSK